MLARNIPRQVKRGWKTMKEVVLALGRCSGIGGLEEALKRA